MTNDDNEDNGDHNIEVPSGSLTMTGYPAGVLVEAGNTAVQSLSTATDVASSTGHEDVATATEALQITFQQHFHITGDHVTINQDQTVNVNQQINTVIQNQINNCITALEASGVPFFDCKDKFDQCMRDAAGTAGQLYCRALYGACLSNRAITTFTPLL